VNGDEQRFRTSRNDGGAVNVLHAYWTPGQSRGDGLREGMMDKGNMTASVNAGSLILSPDRIIDQCTMS